MRHLWVDRIIELERGSHAVGIKTFPLSEDFFNEHFPGNPVVPGVFMVEGMAQTAGVLIYSTTEKKKIAVMASIDRAKFSSFARPGDQVRFTTTIENLGEGHARVRAESRVGDRVVNAARISFTLVDPEQLVPDLYRSEWDHMLSVWLGEYHGKNDQEEKSRDKKHREEESPGEDNE